MSKVLFTAEEDAHLRNELGTTLAFRIYNLFYKDQKIKANISSGGMGYLFDDCLVRSSFINSNM